MIRKPYPLSWKMVLALNTISAGLVIALLSVLPLRSTTHALIGGAAYLSLRTAWQLGRAWEARR